MTAAKFCEWLLDLNATMKEQERHILLLVDNVSSHNESSLVLSNIRVNKLPPNTTAALQPMDQGIIKSLKDMYQDKNGDAELKKFINGEKYELVDLYNAMK
ncbi:hypothetical protein PI125_g7308 [Phytophthora idaei]|nr:hypothetical protein PI125_g7308 [Phytophthora idaei]